MKRLRFLAVAAALVPSSTCYHITVVSGAPTATTNIDKPWQNSFVYGLVPPVEMTSETCTTGVAKVETERSFLNGLVAALTWSIYTPMHVTVTCASGPVPR